MRTFMGKIERRIRERTDQAEVAFVRTLSRRRKQSIQRGHSTSSSLIVVNFNTLDHLKLMLATLAEKGSDWNLNNIVIVDNGSTDGSWDFLKLLSSRTRIYCVRNSGRTSHASGLRFGIKASKQICDNSQSGPENYFVIDADILFLRNDLLSRMVQMLNGEQAAVVGELQYDVGEPYAHPSCMLLHGDSYQDPRVWPFVDHGAPALWLQRSMRRIGMRIVDFPIKKDEYIVHVGRGSLAGIKAFAHRSPYASARVTDPHFHGNPNGEKLWVSKKIQFQDMLSPGSESKLIDYVKEALN